MTNYNINPITVNIGLVSNTATQASFITTYTPFEQTLPYSWYIFDAYGLQLYSGNSILGQAVVEGWGADDDYIINAMADNVGITVIW